MTKVRGRSAARSEQPSPARVGRLIAASRVVLAAFAVVAVFVDPDMGGITESARLGVVPVLLYAFVVLAIVWNMPEPSRLFLIITHLLDFALYTVMIFLTRGAVSIFRHDWSLDTTAATAGLGLRLTSLEDGMMRTIAALR